MDLTQELAEMAKALGATTFGVAPVDRYEGAPRGHHPAELLPGAESVVAFGIRLLPRVTEWPDLLDDSELIPDSVRREALCTLFYQKSGYDIINDRLNQIALSLANHLESLGHASLFFPATGGVTASDGSPLPALFSQRHAAVRAGLGEFGLNNVVVTPQYGPRMRFNSVITRAELEPTPLLSSKACQGLSCQRCVEECAPGALSLLPAADGDDVWLNPPARTNWTTCRESQRSYVCRGHCLRICPAGSPKATPKE